MDSITIDQIYCFTSFIAVNDSIRVSSVVHRPHLSHMLCRVSVNVANTFVAHITVSHCSDILDAITAVLLHDASWLCHSRGK